jgi:hypothetical protein
MMMLLKLATNLKSKIFIVVIKVMKLKWKIKFRKAKMKILATDLKKNLKIIMKIKCKKIQTKNI